MPFIPYPQLFSYLPSILKYGSKVMRLKFLDHSMFKL